LKILSFQIEFASQYNFFFSHKDSIIW